MTSRSRPELLVFVDGEIVQTINENYHVFYGFIGGLIALVCMIIMPISLGIIPSLITLVVLGLAVVLSLSFSSALFLNHFLHTGKWWPLLLIGIIFLYFIWSAVLVGNFSVLILGFILTGIFSLITYNR